MKASRTTNNSRLLLYFAIWNELKPLQKNVLIHYVCACALVFIPCMKWENGVQFTHNK